MMGTQEIESMSRNAAALAAHSKLLPFVVWPEDQGVPRITKSIPFLGGYLPKGWRRVSITRIDTVERGVFMGDNEGFGAYMVDSSGFGASDEPSLTVDEFVARIKPGYGYAIVQAGQFQAKVGVYKQFVQPT